MHKFSHDFTLYGTQSVCAVIKLYFTVDIDYFLKDITM